MIRESHPTDPTPIEPLSQLSHFSQKTMGTVGAARMTNRFILLFLFAIAGRCYPIHAPVVELCYPTQTKRCQPRKNTRRPSPFHVPLGGSTDANNASRILRGFKASDCRGGAANTMTAGRHKLYNLLSGGVAGQ